MSSRPRVKGEGKNLGGKEYLTKKLMSRGLSRRQSVAVINVVLERMIDALRRGEEVEFAYGKLVRVRKSFGRCWDAADDWPANRQPYTVEWELSPESCEQLCGPLDKAERAYREAVWKPPAPEKRDRRGKKQRRVRIGK